MSTKNKLSIGIAAFCILYNIFPDFFPGPIDDMVVDLLGAVAEVMVRKLLK